MAYIFIAAILIIVLFLNVYIVLPSAMWQHNRMAQQSINEPDSEHASEGTSELPSTMSVPETRLYTFNDDTGTNRLGQRHTSGGIITTSGGIITKKIYFLVL